MTLVVREGVRLHYTDSGDGVPVLWHTGGGGDGRMWEIAGYPAALPAHRHLVLDHRGHGRSDCPTGLEAHRLDEYVDDVLAVLDHAGVDRAVFVGYSSGGVVGLAALAKAPDRWSGLVTLGCVPEPDEDPADSLDLAAHLRVVGIRALLDEMGEQEDVPAPTWLLANLAETPTEMFALLLEAWARDVGRLWVDLPRVDVPTLFVAGSEECPTDDLEAAVARTPGAKGESLPGFGHLQTFWQSDVTAPLIADFVTALDAGRLGAAD